MKSSYALALLLLTGCLSSRDTLEPLAQAKGDYVLGEIDAALLAGVGMAAIGSELCGYTLEEWQAMEAAPALPAELSAWFGMEQDGALQSYPARGQYVVTWGGVQWFQQDVAIVASVATPMSAFSVYIEAAGSAGDGQDTGAEDTGGPDDDSAALASAVLSTSLCGTEEHKVSGSISYPISVDYGWTVSLEAAEDEAGMAWASGAVLPTRGVIGWSGSTDIGRASLTTRDATSIADGVWPASIKGSDWEAEVALAIE